MKRLSEIVTKNKTKIGVLLLCFIVLIVACIYYANNNNQIAMIDTPKEKVLKSQLDTAPEGYIPITSAEELAAIKDDLSGKYILMADLNMQDVAYEIIGQTSSAAFTGTFDGNYHKISNLKIESTSQGTGMFGYINGGTINNLMLENAKVTGALSVGVLAGENRGTINNVGVAGEVKGTTQVGGLVGYNGGTITNTYSTSTVTGDSRVASLVGSNYNGKIENSYAIGKVNATTTSNIGGLVGYTGTVTNSYWAIDTTNQSTSYGGEGKFFSSMLNQNTYQNWDFETVWQIEEGTTLPYIKGTTKPESVKKENYTYINWEGEGTEESPYLVKTPEQLNAINNVLSAHYKLANDINMQGKTLDIIGQTNTSAFTGTFNGAGHKINNLTIESANQYVGMFGYVNGGTIENLTLENVNINGTSTSSYAYVGGLTGYSNNGVIRNIYITGEVVGNNYVGGLTVYSSGTITNSYVAAKVKGKTNVGGLAGDNRGTITSSYATGAVTGTNYLGGLVGYNAGTIENSYATGAVTGTNYLGGLVGQNYNGTITNTYAVGEVSGTGANVGGLIGYTNRTITNSYYAKDTTKQLTNIGGEGKFFSSMLNQNTYQNWDFDSVWQIEEGVTLPYIKGKTKPESVKKENHTYINWEGKGTEESPYLVKTLEQLNAINYLLNAHYKLANDINMQDKEYEIIGKTNTLPFTGTFDGNGYKINNLKIESASQYVGMFGYVNGGTIKNLSVENANIKGTANNSYTGGIVGQINNGTIQNSYVTGEVTGISNVGGLVGSLGSTTITNSYWAGTVVGKTNIGGLVGYNGGTITSSYGIGAVTGTSNVGGLVGDSTGAITNTYAIGEVTGGSNVGGLVGYNSRVITNSYAVAKVVGTSNVGGLVGRVGVVSNIAGTATSSYWAVDQSNQPTSALGEGKFFSNMLKQNTFKNWDFSTIWEIQENALPHLKGMTKLEDIKAENYTYVNWEGEGTEESPYLIKTVKQLNLVNNLLNAHYKLANDIDMQDKAFEIIGKTNTLPFTGTFDGNNHKISNLTIESENQYVGMFGYISGGTIKNLLLENVNITGTSTHIGGLAGSNYNGTITNVGVTGEVTSTNNTVGGLLGYNSGTVTNAYSTVTVSGNSTVGGLVGDTRGTLTNTYAVGKVIASGTSNIGGLTGYKSGTVNNSYWAIDISGQSISSGGEGKFLSVMLKQQTFKNWDFDTTWKIEENTSLPYLKEMAKPEAVNKTNYTYINWEGEGTSEKPYLIKTAEQLNTVNNLLTVHYKLANDIDMQDKEYNIIGQTSSTPFVGTFDGNNHKISNLKIESTNDYVGMFGYINGGTVKNLILENANIKGKASIGGLVGYNVKGTITNIGVTGEVVGTGNCIGGLIGQNGGTITNSYTITKVTGEKDYVGGLIGYNSGTITNAYSTAEVRGTNYVGGLIGQNYSGTITNTYAVGKVTATGTSYIGGLIGYKSGTVNNSYWAIDTTNQVTSPAGEGKFLSAMLREATFKNWDFSTIWKIEEGNTLPYLKGMSKPETVKKENYKYVDIEGTGSDSDPYLIKNAEQLNIVNKSLSSYYILANDIDMQNKEYNIIGKTNTLPFTGTFDGNGHKITNLTIESDNTYVGMFGVVERGTIKNIGLENVNITGTNTSSSSYVGGLVASNYGTIEKSYVTGEVTGTNTSNSSYVGGLVGNNGATITNAYTTATVIGTSNVGGLVGQSYSGNITNTYAVGKVTGTTNIGGLVGYNRSGTITNSYWASEASSQSTTKGGEGKTTQELLQQATFKNWDFTTIWEIEEGHILPYFKGIARPKAVEVTDLEGKGTQDSPYLIKTPEELTKIQYVLSGYYQIANDIDLSEIQNFELIKGTFIGTLDGNNHSINNLTMKLNSSHTGLFEQNEGTIKNLKLNNVNIESSYNGDISYIGGVCAYNKGTIKNIEISGTIKNIGNVTNLYMGQIVGYNKNLINKAHSNGNITNDGTVTNGYVGGIAGYNDSIVRIVYNTGSISLKNIENSKVGGIAGKSSYISDSYSKGNINVNATSATIGGIVGENVGTIRNTYSIENIEKLATTQNLGGIAGENILVVKSSYYNNSSIVEQEGKGTLKTIEELKQQDTFENWDFDNIWSIEENTNTPVFQDIFKNDENYYGKDEYEEDSYWEWHTRTTTNDQAYNGKHIVINKGKSIDFYGYGITSYKDYLYKYYDYAGEKTFSFTIEEVRTDYHTLEGAGFIFNASKIDDKLSGYVLIIGQNDIRIYRLDNVNATAFETTDNKTVANYGTLIATGKKIESSTHKLIIKTSPTNVTVIDSGEEVINQDLDYTKHAGEDFGLIVSYTNHNCSSLSQIHFLGLNIEVKDYNIPVLKTNEIGNKLEGAKFQVKNTEGEIIREGSTNAKGIYNIKGLQEGTYTLEEVKAPGKHAFNNYKITFKVTNDGKVLDVNTNEEITIKIINERLKFSIKVVDSNGNPIPNSKISLYDEDGNVVLGSDGQPIVVTTDSDGTAIITDIEKGKYTFKQTEVPSDYVLDDTIYTGEIKEDGTVKIGDDERGTIVNKKYGNVTIRKYITDTKIPVSGAVIGIYREDKTPITDKEGNPVQITTSEAGTITFKITPGTYTYKEITAPAGYVLNDTEYTFTVADDGVVTFNTANGIIYNNRVRMAEKDNFTVTKYKTGTDIAVAGAVIGVFDAKGNKVTELITNESGIITVSGLEVGSYYYKEIQAPAGYILNNTAYHFTVNNDGTVTLAEGVDRIIYNTKGTMKDPLTITKYRINTTIGLPGAIIGVFDETGKEVARQTTNESGIITISGLEAGNYYYKEIQAPAGYMLNNTQYQFTVTNEGTVTHGEETTFVIYDSRVRMAEKDNFTVTKYRTGTDIAVSGAVIGIFDAEGNKVTELITNESGIITVSGLEVGSYYYKEIQAPSGYILNNNQYHFTVTDDGSVTFAEGTNKIIYNDREKVYGNVTIRKYKTGTEVAVSGAVIGIYKADGTPMLDKEGNPVQLTTSEDGTIAFRITPGTYKYKELTAPNGYILNNTEYTFTVSEEGVVTFDSNNGIIYNTRVTMKDPLIITKYRLNTTIGLPGAIIGIFDETGKEVARQTTNEAGQVTFMGLVSGNYYYKEITAPAGYILNNTQYYFTVTNDGTVKVTGETNFIIYNARVKAEHTVITKYVTDTKIPVSGAVIGLFDTNGNKLVEQTTNEVGQVDFTDLEPGTYKYKELRAPNGYVLNETIYTVTINDNGTITFDSANGIIYNTRVKIKDPLTITKYKINTTIGLPGAIIGIFDATGKEVARQTTNEVGQVTFTELEVGSYYYKEISAPAGYILNNTQYYFTVENDGTVKATGETNFIIYNDRVSKDHIIVTKYIKDTQIPVSGAVIGLFDTNGNKLVEQTTNEKGQVDFTGLEPGTYKYKELRAPNGYVLNETIYTVTIAEDKTVTFDSANGIIYNTRVTMKDPLIITKYKINTTVGLPGAIIGVFDTTGKEVARQTTNEFGKVTFIGLVSGNYYYKEIQAPEGYVLNNTAYHFTVNNDGSVTHGEETTFVIYDSRVTMQEKDKFTITKYRTGTKIPVSGAVIGLFDEAGKEIARQTTNEFGTITISGLEVGSYYYKEIQAPEGYILNNTQYHFRVNNDGSVTFNENTNGIIYNKKKEDEPDIPEIIYADVTLIKYEEGTTIGLPGAVIGIYDSKKNEVKVTTNKNGIVSFKAKPGIYQYQELVAPNGYILNNTIYSFTVTQTGKVIFDKDTKGIIYNKKIEEKPDGPDNPEIIYGDITLIKYEEGTTIGLPGAVIGIYDSNNNEVKATTNKNGIIKFKARPGTYTYKELVAPTGYILNSATYTFTVAKDGTVTFKDNTNGIIYNKKKVTVPDKPDTPDVPNKPTTPDKPKDNVINSGGNTTTKEPTENLVNGKIPQTGQTNSIITMTIGIAMIGIYFGIKIRDKQ